MEAEEGTIWGEKGNNGKGEPGRMVGEQDRVVGEWDRVVGERDRVVGGCKGNMMYTYEKRHSGIHHSYANYFKRKHNGKRKFKELISRLLSRIL